MNLSRDYNAHPDQPKFPVHQAEEHAMPYFVYQFFTKRRMQRLGEFGKFRDAKNLAREQRADAPADADYQIKVIFAANADEAERLLAEDREPRPLGEDG